MSFVMIYTIFCLLMLWAKNKINFEDYKCTSLSVCTSFQFKRDIAKTWFIMLFSANCLEWCNCFLSKYKSSSKAFEDSFFYEKNNSNVKKDEYVLVSRANRSLCVWIDLALFLWICHDLFWNIFFTGGALGATWHCMAVQSLASPPRTTKLLLQILVQLFE